MGWFCRSVLGKQIVIEGQNYFALRGVIIVAGKELHKSVREHRDFRQFRITEIDVESNAFKQIMEK